MSDLISKMQKVANQLDSHNHFDEANYITSLMVKIAQANTGFGGAPAVKPLSFDEDFYQNLPTTETYNPSDPSKPSDTPDAVQNLQDYQRHKPEIDSIENDFETRVASVKTYITRLGKTKKYEMMEYLMGILVHFMSNGQANFEGTNQFPNKDVLGTVSNLQDRISKLENVEIQNKVNEFILSRIKQLENTALTLIDQDLPEIYKYDGAFQQFKLVLMKKFDLCKAYFEPKISDLKSFNTKLPRNFGDVVDLWVEEKETN